MAKVEIDKDRCKGCFLCVHFCPVGCLKISTGINKRGNQYAEKDEKKTCVGCGNCYLICPDFCIKIYE